MKALRWRGGSQPGGEPGEAGCGPRPPGGAGEELREGSGRWRQGGVRWLQGELPGDWPGSRGDVTRRRCHASASRKAGTAEGAWELGSGSRHISLGRCCAPARGSQLSLWSCRGPSPTPCAPPPRLSAVPPGLARTGAAWNRAPRPGWRGCSSRRPHWGRGSGAQQSERTGSSANPGGPCPGFQHRNPAPPRWAGTRDTPLIVRPPTQVPCL